MRFTADLAVHAAQRMNPLGEREVILRGYKIGVIENTGTLKDQFDVVDLSDNEIQRVGNFTTAKRLTTLLLHNNRVVGVDANLGDQLPNLETLMLCHNRLDSLTQLAALKACPKLQHLSCVGNPIKRLEHYRAFLIALIPSLKTLDFKKVKPAEREQAAELFPADKASKADLTLVSTTAGAGFAPPPPRAPPPSALANLTPEQKAAIRRAVANATTPAEVDALEKQLKAGVIPDTAPPGPPPPPGSMPPPPPPRAAAPPPPPPAPPPAPPAPPPAPPAQRASTGGFSDLGEDAAPAPAAMDVDDGPSAEDVEKMKVSELKAALEARGLPSDGLKKVLKERLLGALAGGGGDDGAAAPEPEPEPAKPAAQKPASKKPAAAEAEPARPTPDALTVGEVEKMKVCDLKLALEARGLSTEGLKKALKARLLESLA